MKNRAMMGSVAESPKTKLELTEWEERSPATCRALQGVFLADDPRLCEVAEILTKRGLLRILELRSGLQVASTSFVGRLSLGDIEITIRPKIPGMKLLNLMRYAFNFRNLTMLPREEYGATEGTFQQLLIHQLASEASELFSRGLLKAYKRTEEETEVFRGRLDLSRIARRLPPESSAMPCITHPRLQDTVLNSVILAGLMFASGISDNGLLRKRLNRMYSAIQANVSVIKLDSECIRQARHQINRLTRKYEPAIDIIEILYQSSGMLLEAGDRSVELPGFLFDMNRFWQALITRFLADNLSSFTIVDEVSLIGLMKYIPGLNPRGQKAPRPRPDIVVKQTKNVNSVLDTKYRDLWEQSLPGEMLYQLSMYALSGTTEEPVATIIYPTMHDEAKEAAVGIYDPITGSERGRVIIRPACLNKLESLVSEARGWTREGELFAEYLALGKPSPEEPSSAMANMSY